MNEKHRRIYTNITHSFPDGTGFSIPGWVMMNRRIQELKNMPRTARKFRRDIRMAIKSAGRRAALAELKVFYRYVGCD